VTFSLPEDDQDFLQEKGWKHELKSEQVPNAAPGTLRNAVLLPEFVFEGNLYRLEEGQLVRTQQCRMLVIIPSGYSTTRLDSFYTIPRLKRVDGTDPLNATHTETLFGEPWQFWSRHLEESDWRAGIDGLDIFSQYILTALRTA
jgi:hypothetical protein